MMNAKDVREGLRERRKALKAEIREIDAMLRGRRQARPKTDYEGGVRTMRTTVFSPSMLGVHVGVSSASACIYLRRQEKAGRIIRVAHGLYSAAPGF